ncbi:gamma-glutamylcyclotransferase [Azospirillum sp. SYSU D00513]|uniref:gamma-glutamylcyclotransferase n=1 Tax=Azospirillum sp. SYSU D00513 TaxID=2812561 RepID=UPI001A97BA6F|nr:gamma-glutamylcyclotransferase [Azospirillum sp. SYSU D00513]
MQITRDSLASGEILDFIRRESACGLPDHRALSDAELAESLRQGLSEWDGRSDVWLFGYGSLIWNPAIRYSDKRIARLDGWHRRFCLWLRMGRGSLDNPGLMLALDEGGSCRGVAFRIPASEVMTELPLVWVREMTTGSYAARWVTLESDDGRFRALTFVADRGHPRYAGPVGEEEAAGLIARAAGTIGSCASYLLSTADHLRELGLEDSHLENLAARVRALKAEPPGAHAGDPTTPKV